MKPTSLLFGVLLLGCSGTTTSPPSDTTATTTTNHAPVIAALKTHDGKVSIVGGGELRVNVTKDDGTVVADNATLDELRAKDPEAWALVRSAVAQSKGTYVDATFHESPAPTLK